MKNKTRKSKAGKRAGEKDYISDFIKTRQRSASKVNSGLSYDEFMKVMSENDGEGRSIQDKKMQEDPFGVDISFFNTDSEGIIKSCQGTVYGYVRVSTDHQDYQRQIDALVKLGVKEENIFKDKKSGKDFYREEFMKLMRILKSGDCIVVQELDRFGRNMTEIKNHWSWIT